MTGDDMAIQHAGDVRLRRNRGRSALGFRKLFGCGDQKGADPHYTMMALEAIKAFPVHELARGHRCRHSATNFEI
jgi:hypothetical protein